jgi:phosphocarrier protein HPr
MTASEGIDASATIRRMVTICNKRGLHARAAAKLVKLAGTFDADVRVTKNGSIVSGQSIMGLMMLAAAIGSVVEIRATGRQALEAADAIAGLVTGGFDEED